MYNHNDKELLVSLYTMINELNKKIDALNLIVKKNNAGIEKEWLTIAEAAKVAGVSNNTFTNFRKMGLKVCEIEGTKRVNKNDLNTFLKKFAS